MAEVRQTFTRPSINIAWYQVLDTEIAYIRETYPNLSYNFEADSSESLTFTKIRAGSIEDCQRFLSELEDPGSIVYKVRRKYNDDNNITYTIELIE